MRDVIMELAEALAAFARERDWEKFHAPKNLAMALTVEAGELLEHFQWLTEVQSRELSPETLAEVRDELADILLYLVRLADVLGVDLAAAARSKMLLNAKKYPAAQVRGSAKKSTRYRRP